MGIGTQSMVNKFFRLSIRALIAKIGLYADNVVGWCPDGDFFASCIFSETRVARFTVSDLQSKFALRPHHVWKYGRHPISDR